MNAAVEIPIRDNRRQAKCLYWRGWRVCDSPEHLGET
ncbi:terminase gpP N-terminus-related DNA-binding protein, partial [Pseudomonas aeruginosa]